MNKQITNESNLYLVKIKINKCTNERMNARRRAIIK